MPPKRASRPSRAVGDRGSQQSVLDDLLTRLAPLPVSTRAMFGGVGLYLEGRYFGIVDDGVVYFRTDDTTRQAYIERGMPALQPKYRPAGPKNVDRTFRVPDEVLADGALLREWAMAAANTKRR